ncbi:hypothetical protein EniLVp02_0017 [Vibrio phage EniLVp02]
MSAAGHLWIKVFLPRGVDMPVDPCIMGTIERQQETIQNRD